MNSKSVLVVGGPRDGQVYLVDRDETTLTGLPIRHQPRGDYEWVVLAGDRLRLVLCARCRATYSIDDPFHICD